MLVWSRGKWESHTDYLPRNGTKSMNVPATARCFGWNKSAEVPAVTGSVAPPKKPAKNRRIHNAVIFGENPAASAKTAEMGGEAL